jgi:hypothetical protein
VAQEDRNTGSTAAASKNIFFILCLCFADSNFNFLLTRIPVAIPVPEFDSNKICLADFRRCDGATPRGIFFQVRRRKTGLQNKTENICHTIIGNRKGLPRKSRAGRKTPAVKEDRMSVF